MMMFEQIEMVRQVSHQVYEHEKEPMFEAGVPAMIKKHNSYTATALQLPEITVSVKEEDCILINTCDPAALVEEEEAPAFAFCDKTHKCGHACKGVSKERHCLPCLNTECAERDGYCPREAARSMLSWSRAARECHQREGCPAVPTKLDGLCGKITKSAYLVSFLGVVSLTRLEYR